MSKTNDKPKATKPQPNRSSRLGSYYYTQSRWIEQVFDDHNSKYADRHLLSEQIMQLLKAAGMGRKLQTVLAQPGRYYIAAVKALRDKEANYATLDPLAKIAACLETCKKTFAATPAKQSQAQTQTDQPATPAHPPSTYDGNQTRIRVAEGDDDLAAVGINAGDYLFADEAERELQPGELAALLRIGAETWAAGVVTTITPDEITLDEGGQTRTFTRADLETICRVTWYARRFRPAPATPAGRIKQLRARLERLDEEDDQIIRCTERFRVEKQIYDLEREQARDEWPDVIGERGA
ncbi:MAG: hypothetical protein ACJ74W_01360 [Pyrinomonadaceae bacterium]